jgi:hypothetical protein
MVLARNLVMLVTPPPLRCEGVEKLRQIPLSLAASASKSFILRSAKSARHAPKGFFNTLMSYWLGGHVTGGCGVGISYVARI